MVEADGEQVHFGRDFLFNAVCEAVIIAGMAGGGGIGGGNVSLLGILPPSTALRQCNKAKKSPLMKAG
jgi:hypothetical protein